MRYSIFAALFLFVWCVCSAAVGTTRPIPCTFSNIYLDVVVAIDFSSNMGTNGILQAVADVASVFSPSTISQTLGQTTRVGLVNYTKTGYTMADLFHFNSTQQFASELFNYVPAQTTVNSSYIEIALMTSNSLLRSNRASGNRNNVPQAIIVYTSQFDLVNEPNAVTRAKNLQNSGISIITVDNSAGQNIAGLSNIASPGMTFLSGDPMIVSLIQGALCIANAHCRPGWEQVADISSNTTFGECLYIGSTVAANRSSAVTQCNNMSGYLVSQFDAIKNNFVKGAAAGKGIAFYWLGLQADEASNTYKWDQMPGQTPVTLVDGAYSDWVPGEPMAMSGSPFVYDYAERGAWMSTPADDTNAVICQTNTCDTDRYC